MLWVLLTLVVPAVYWLVACCTGWVPNLVRDNDGSGFGVLRAGNPPIRRL